MNSPEQRANRSETLTLTLPTESVEALQLVADLSSVTVEDVVNVLLGFELARLRYAGVLVSGPC